MLCCWSVKVSARPGHHTMHVACAKLLQPQEHSPCQFCGLTCPGGSCKLHWACACGQSVLAPDHPQCLATHVPFRSGSHCMQPIAPTTFNALNALQHQRLAICKLSNCVAQILHRSSLHNRLSLCPDGFIAMLNIVTSHTVTYLMHTANAGSLASNLSGS